jgi:predicted peptidase
MNDAADRRGGKRYRLSVVVRNDDSKTIRAVQFEYPVRISRGRTSPEQITFKSKKEIGPSDTVTLSYAFITNQYVFRFGQATVKRIEYTDGSVWER